MVRAGPLQPRRATLARARDVNTRLRQSIPDGFALDDTHVPHITVLQRYVRTADLGEVLSSVENTVLAADTAELTLHAIAFGTSTGAGEEAPCSS